MYIFVGLGNPGTRYEGTRHNMGFDVIDRVIEDNRIPFSGRKFHSFLGSGRIGAEKIIVAKPVTYMNLSGTAVREIVDFYKIDPANELVVISDDIDLEPGHVRIRKKGSAGGQNGLKHIIQCLGTQEFIRIRVGTGARQTGISRTGSCPDFRRMRGKSLTKRSCARRKRVRRSSRTGSTGL